MMTNGVAIVKPSIMNDTKVERSLKLRVFKRGLTKLIRENQMDILTGVHDSVLADHLTQSLMNITKLLDGIYEFENTDE